MKTALIIGISGQDGSYLAEFLLENGYRVVGTSRDKIKAKSLLPLSLDNRVELLSLDLKSQEDIEQVLDEYKISEMYNFASFSSGSGMFDDAERIGNLNGLAVTRMLESIRKVDPKIRFCQASSSEIFGYASETPQSEKTSFNPRSPYGAAKLYADSMMRIYKQHHNLFTCSAILFNHESPRRGLEFVTRKITHTVAKIKLGLASDITLGNLEAKRDWGYAGDYVRAMWLMLQQHSANDYVLATGIVHSVRELCDLAFSHVDLDYQAYVREDSNFYRLSEPVQLVGDASKAMLFLGWQPQVNFKQLIGMMVDADLKKIAENNYLY
jgi:GDPmannose 4,6-dehydratase